MWLERNLAGLLEMKLVGEHQWSRKNLLDRQRTAKKIEEGTSQEKEIEMVFSLRYYFNLPDLPRPRKERQFKKVFGFVPSKAGRIRNLEQQTVDNELASLARKAERLYRREEMLYDTVNPYGAGCTPLVVREKVLELRMEIETTKSSFWRAHRLARSFGFKVGEKIRDYLTDADLDTIQAGLARQ